MPGFVDPPIYKAIKAAWPGADVYERFRRRVAMELALMPEGPLGPNSALSAKLSSVMRQHHPSLVSEVLSGGKLRLQILLARAPGLPRNSGLPPGADDPVGGSFLYWQPSPYDLCAVLDVPALLKWHASGGSADQETQPGAPPPDSAAARAAAFRQRLPHPKAPYHPGMANPGGNTGIRTVGNGVNIDLSGLVPRYGKPGADLESPYYMSAGSRDAAEGLVLSGPDDGPMTGSGVAGLVDLAHMAFPGPSPANQLRRSLVGLLAKATGDGEYAGLPRHSVPWLQVKPLVAASRAASVLPSLPTPAVFKTFLLHPASCGAFAATRILRDPTNPSSTVDCVSLSEAALRRAAGPGVRAAIAAAWPGADPLQQLKREAAEVLTRAWSDGAGSYCMNSGMLGAELKRRRPTLYAHVRGPGVVGGLMPRLDEGERGGLLVYIREDGKEGYLQLKLHALVREFPPDDGRDMGLNPPAAAASQLAPAATAAVSQPAQGAPINASSASFPVAEPAGGPSTAAAVSSEDAMPDPWANMPRPLPFDHNPNQGAASPSAPAELHQAAVAMAAMEGGGMEASAEVALQQSHHAQQQQHYHTSGPLVEPVVQWVRQSSDFDTMVTHCYSAASMGLAVHGSPGPGGSSGGGSSSKPVVAAIYTPACTTEGNGAVDAYGVVQQTVTWPCTVYLIEVALVAAEGAAEGAVAPLPGAAEAFCALIESPYVSKVVHGAEQVAALAPICGASTIAPILDTRIVLQAIMCMLPPLPALPPRPPPYAAVGPLAAMTVAKLSACVAALRDELVKTGLWLERADLLGALVARHSAAVREDLFGVREWSSNVPAHEAALAAAARHLPELWEALTYEAVPWVAMAASASATATAIAAAKGGGGGSGNANGQRSGPLPQVQVQSTVATTVVSAPVAVAVPTPVAPSPTS